MQAEPSACEAIFFKDLTFGAVTSFVYAVRLLCNAACAEECMWFNIHQFVLLECGAGPTESFTDLQIFWCVWYFHISPLPFGE